MQVKNFAIISYNNHIEVGGLGGVICCIVCKILDMLKATFYSIWIFP